MAFLNIRCNYGGLQGFSPDPSRFLWIECGAKTWIIRGTNAMVMATIRRRSSFPVTYYELLPDGSCSLGYGDPQAAGINQEFLKVRLYPSGRIRIERDSHATLPLFYGLSAGCFVVSNHYEDVVEAMPVLTLNEKGIIDALVPQTGRPYIWNEVGALGCNQILTVDSAGRLNIETGAGAPWQPNPDVPSSDPRAWFGLIDTTLERTLHCSGALDNPFGVELSAGLDSSLLPLYAATHYPHADWHGMSLIGPGKKGLTQTAKLQSIFVRAPQAKLSLFDPAEIMRGITGQFDLSEMRPIFPYEFGLRPLFAQNAQAWAMAGIQIVFNGFGAEELFAYNGAPGEDYASAVEVRLAQVPDFLTPYARQLLHDIIHQKDTDPIPLLPSLIAETGTANNVYIDQDIWPVSPFLDTELFAYCQALPWRFRKNKRILRMYYRWEKFPPILYNTVYPNEDFNAFFDKASLQPGPAALIEQLAHDSVVGALGYIEPGRLLHIYRNACQRGYAASGTVSCINYWLPVEMSVRLALASGQWRP